MKYETDYFKIINITDNKPGEIYQTDFLGIQNLYKPHYLDVNLIHKETGKPLTLKYCIDEECIAYSETNIKCSGEYIRNSLECLGDEKRFSEKEIEAIINDDKLENKIYKLFTKKNN